MAVGLSDSSGELPSLGDHFAPALEIGVAIEPEQLAADGAFVRRHFRRLTAENAMKWGRLSDAPGRYDFARADALADFARRERLPMTGHTLLWHQMQPPWLFEAAGARVSAPELAARVERHVFTLVERYADVVDNWDVVNEAISDREGEHFRTRSEHSRFHEIFGDERFVELAFRAAGDAVARFAPRTKLYYNDYNIELAGKREKTIRMLRDLRARGVRVDGVGIQGHVGLDAPSAAEVERAIEAFAAEGLLVKISELDVSVYPGDDHERKRFDSERAFDAELDRRLSERYRELFQVFRRKARHLTSVVFWGLHDGVSWLNDFPLPRRNYPLLFDHELRPKSAFFCLLET